MARFPRWGRRGWVLVGLLGVGGIAQGGLARADDAPDQPKVPGAPLVLRRYEVSALTRGHPDFGQERGPYPVPSDLVNDQGWCLFGAESEEESKPYGGCDDLMELVKAELPAGTFEGEGVSISSSDDRALLVRVPAAAHGRIAAYLERLAREALDTITVDVVALRVNGPAEGEGGIGGAIAKGAWTVVEAARATGLPNQRFVGRTGGQQAYVQDEDVEVAEDARTPDPIVGVIPDGLSFEVRPLVASPDRVRLDLRTWLSLPGPVRTQRAVGDDPVETVEVDGRVLSAVVEAKPGAWSLLTSTGDVAFAVRATVRPLDVPARQSPPPLSIESIEPTGPLVRTSYDVTELVTRVVNRRGVDLNIFPSNFTPAEAPSLREPMSLVSGDQLVELMKVAVAAGSWETEGTSADLRSGRLDVRQDAPRQAAVAAFLDGLRALARTGWRLRLDLVNLPVSSLPEFWSGLDDGSTLLAAGPAALLARSGAVALDVGAVRLQSGQRNAAFGGKSHAYVADYDVEIAAKSVIGNPITHAALEGLSVDLEACPTLDGAALACQARVVRTTWRGSRQVATRSGAIECPSLGRQAWQGAAVIPVGATRIVAAGGDGKTITLFLLTVNAD